MSSTPHFYSNLYQWETIIFIRTKVTIAAVVIIVVGLAVSFSSSQPVANAAIFIGYLVKSTFSIFFKARAATIAFANL